MVCESVNSRISLDWFQHVNYTVSREKTFWFKIFFTFSAERIPFHWFSANHLNIFTFSLKKVYSQIKMGLCVKYLWLRLQLWQERMRRLGDEGFPWTWHYKPLHCWLTGRAGLSLNGHWPASIAILWLIDWPFQFRYLEASPNVAKTINIVKVQSRIWNIETQFKNCKINGTVHFLKSHVSAPGDRNSPICFPSWSFPVIFLCHNWGWRDWWRSCEIMWN